MPADTTFAMNTAQTPRSPLRTHWRRRHATVNFRGDPSDPGLLEALSQTVGLPWPTRADECPTDGSRRVVWAGPDDWFVIGPPGSQEALTQQLRTAAGERHCAVTDVSSGYAVLTLAGEAARDVLAQGCPLDLHPRLFAVGQSAGTHFFKASVWLWRSGDSAFDLLVRTSFSGYVEEMLRRCSLECGMLALDASPTGLA